MTPLPPFPGRVTVCPNHILMSQMAARRLVYLLQQILIKKPRVILMPSGSQTPLLMYHILREQYLHSLDWKRIFIVQMNEYYDLPEKEAGTLGDCLWNSLIKPMGLLPKQVLFWTKQWKTSLRSMQKYEERVMQWGGIDVALHDVGANGRIAFNEPGDMHNADTRLVCLLQEKTFNIGGDSASVGRAQWGVTLGFRALAAVTHNLVLGSGAINQRSVLALLRKEPIERWPISFLANKNTDVYVDKAAVFGIET